MNWILALRRFRLSLRKRMKSMESCIVCGCAAEPYEYVCDSEACQLEAFQRQAMLASEQAEPPASLRRVRFSAAAETNSQAGSSCGIYC